MTTSRRKFLKTSGLSVAAVAFGTHKLFAAADPDVYLGPNFIRFAPKWIKIRQVR